MVAQELPRMTVEEWRRLLDRNPDAKYEYIDGHVYLMSGGSLDHADIAGNVYYALRSALPGGCRARNSDAATRLSVSRYTFPDVSVSCDPGDRGAVREVRSPRVIVEVLSESTEAYDRGDKFGYYRACPSVQEYVLVATRHQAVEVYRRTPEGWMLEEYGPDETVRFKSIEVSVPVSVFCEGTEVPVAMEEREGEV